jgi:hypothetical protein
MNNYYEAYFTVMFKIAVSNLSVNIGIVIEF